jgi:hypothetical protein
MKKKRIKKKKLGDAGLESLSGGATGYVTHVQDDVATNVKLTINKDGDSTTTTAEASNPRAASPHDQAAAALTPITLMATNMTANVENFWRRFGRF